jgi:hypothetical protein
VDKKNTKYNNIRPREGLGLNSSEYLKNQVGTDLSYKLDPTTYKRHLFSAYGFDFKNDSGILTPVNKTRYN